METVRQVKLIPADGEPIIVDRKVAKLSTMVNEMLDDEDDDKCMVECPFPNVTRNVLEKVIEFCIYHVDNPMTQIEQPLKNVPLEDIVSEWDAKFIDVEYSFLFSIVLAANYMEIPSLLDLSCAKIAILVRGKTPQEIRTYVFFLYCTSARLRTNKFISRSVFGVTMTHEEELQVRNANKWCEELL